MLGGVLLIDLENMVGHCVSVRTLGARLEVLRECAGQVAEIVAACATSAIRPEGEQVLHGHGVRLLEVSPAKHAAPDALLREVARIAGLGYHRFAAASKRRSSPTWATGDPRMEAADTEPRVPGLRHQVHRPSIRPPPSRADSLRRRSRSRMPRRRLRPPRTSAERIQIW